MTRILLLHLAVMTSVAGELGSLAWIAGTWQGELDGSKIEEVWNDPSGATMTGMFRLMKRGATAFYEYMVMEETSVGVMLRLRHFRPGLVAVEPKDAPMLFHLQSNDGTEAVFIRKDKPVAERLIFRKDGPDGLFIVLDKEESRQEFRYRRKAVERR